VSRENVEVVRRAWEASTQRDNEAVFRLYDPEVEIHDVFYNRVYRDFDGVREYFGDCVSTFDEWGGGGRGVDRRRGRRDRGASFARAGQAKRNTSRGTPVARVDATRRQAVAAADLREQGRSPQSRGAGRCGREPSAQPLAALIKTAAGHAPLRGIPRRSGVVARRCRGTPARGTRLSRLVCPLRGSGSR